MTGVQITLSGASLEELFATMREMLPESEAPAQEPEKPKRGKGKGKAAAAKDEAGAEAVEEAEAGDEPFGDDDTDAVFGKAIDVLMKCYDDDEGKDKVKALLEEYGVKKFSEIDKSHGADLLEKAEVLQADID